MPRTAREGRKAAARFHAVLNWVKCEAEQHAGLCACKAVAEPVHSNGFSSPEHGRDQFCDSRMNVHGALNQRVWRVGAYHVEERMNYLVALDSQERCSKDPSDVQWLSICGGPMKPDYFGASELTISLN